MRSLLWATGVAVILAAGATSANPLDDAKGGMKAFDKGDNSTAVRLFTSALNSHRLTRTDQELALVKRAEARIALGQGQAALADAYSALNLDPADNEAIATRDRAQALIAPPPERTAAAAPEPASYLKSQAAYQEALKHYEEQKEADAKRYEEQQAKYNAELKAQQAREAQASALHTTPGGSQSAPAPTAKPKVQATAQAAPKPTSNPTVQATAQPAPKPTAKPTQKKAVRKATPAPEERPRFY
jgi:tetratricopeptide (TPR) repeat protein